MNILNVVNGDEYGSYEMTARMINDDEYKH